jgi:hypothetical protein
MIAAVAAAAVSDLQQVLGLILLRTGSAGFAVIRQNLVAVGSPSRLRAGAPEDVAAGRSGARQPW